MRRQTVCARYGSAGPGAVPLFIKFKENYILYNLYTRPAESLNIDFRHNFFVSCLFCLVLNELLVSKKKALKGAKKENEKIFLWAMAPVPSMGNIFASCPPGNPHNISLYVAKKQ